MLRKLLCKVRFHGYVLIATVRNEDNKMFSYSITTFELKKCRYCGDWNIRPEVFGFKEENLL